MRFLALLLLAFVAGCCGCASVPSHSQLRATALRLEFNDGVCSGTAVGPSVALTATHCFRKGAELQSINGQAVKILSRIDDGKDHTLVRVSIEFKQYAKRGHGPVQGDRVRWFGNPAGQPDCYREGYVVRSQTDGVLVDAQAWFGDSGSGVFNDRGELVGVLSAITGPNPAFVLAVLLPIRFTEEQWKAAGA